MFDCRKAFLIKDKKKWYECTLKSEFMYLKRLNFMFCTFFACLRRCSNRNKNYPFLLFVYCIINFFLYVSINANFLIFSNYINDIDTSGTDAF